MIFLKNIKNIKKFFKPRFLIETTALFFGHYTRVSIFLFAIALVVFCINLWHETIYKAQWSDEQKQEYINNKEQGIVFNEKGFEYDVSVVTNRKEESQKDIGELTDIFRLKKKSVSTSAISSSNVSAESHFSSGTF